MPVRRALFAFLCCGLFAGLASPAVVYAVFDNSGTNTFGTLDTGTGVFTSIATQTPNLFGMGFAPDDTLYGTDSASPDAGVYSVDTATGALTNLGVSTDSVQGSTVGSDGLIYAVSQNIIFYTIDPTTLATNVISSLGFTSDGLAVFANGVFYTDLLGTTLDDTLEAVNPVTGVATAIGTGLGVQIFAGVNVNGTIYGAGRDGNLYTINLTTGVASLAVPITGATGDLDALAFALPEPATFLLSGVALACLAARCRFKPTC
jgi:hypothetical protein